MNKTRLLEKISIQSGVSLDECGTVLKTFEKVLSEELSRKMYRYGGGNFWVAKESGKVVGTIGLMNAGNGVVILKKFFVYEPYRSFPHNLGRQLYAIFLDFAQKHNFREIILDTPRNTDRVYRFYEKAGFRKISQEKFPIIYDYLYRDSDFSY